MSHFFKKISADLVMGIFSTQMIYRSRNFRGGLVMSEKPPQMYYVKKKASFLARGRRVPQLITIDTNSVDCSNGDWGKDTYL